MAEKNAIQSINVELELSSRLNENSIRARKETEIDAQLIDGLVKLVKDKTDFPALKENAEKVEDLYEIVIKPRLQKGINQGDLHWDGASAYIRDIKSGQVAGNIEVSKHELNQLTSKKNAISNATKAICSVSGQLQLVEITQLLDQLLGKVDSIIENERDNTNARLTGTITTLNKALSIKADSIYKMDRINNCIMELEKLADFFKSKINKNLDMDITKTTMDSIIDGFKRTNSQDTKFYNHFREWLNKSNYDIQGYIYSKLALSKCYEVIHGFEEGLRELLECSQEYDQYLSLMAQRITYILKEKELSVSQSQDINQVIAYVLKNPRHSRIEKELLVLEKSLLKGKSDIDKIENKDVGSIILKLENKKEFSQGEL